MPKLDARGRVTLPLAVRDGLRLRTGDSVAFVRTAEGWVLQRAADEAAESVGATRATTRNTEQHGSG